MVLVAVVMAFGVKAFTVEHCFWPEDVDDVYLRVYFGLSQNCYSDDLVV